MKSIGVNIDINIAKNPRISIDYTMSLQNLISQKPTWNSHWSIISARNLKRQHQCPYFANISVFSVKKDFSEEPVNLDMGIQF